VKRIKLFAVITIILILCTAQLYAEDLVVPVIKAPSEVTNIGWDRKGINFSYEVGGTVFKRDSYSLVLKDQLPSDGNTKATPTLPEEIKTYMGVTSVCVTRSNNYIVADGPRTAGLYNAQGQKLKTYTSKNLITGFSLSPDEETLIIYDIKNTLNFYNARTGTYIGYSPKFGTKKIKDVVMNADSSKLLVSTSDNSVYIVRTQDILYSPESTPPALRQFPVTYNVVDPNDKGSGIVEFNVKEVRDPRAVNGGEFIKTPEPEPKKEEPRYVIEEKPKREVEVPIVQPPVVVEQEYTPPSLVETEIYGQREEPETIKPEVLESIVTEYKVPEPKPRVEPPVVTYKTEEKVEAAAAPPPPPEVRMITNTVTVKETQEETVQPTVPVVIPKTEVVKEPEVVVQEPQTQPQVQQQKQVQQAQTVPQQTIDLTKILGEDAVTYTQGQAPQIIIIQQQPAQPETKTEYVYVEVEPEEEEPKTTKKKKKQVKKIEEPEEEEEVITQDVVVEVDQIEEPEPEPEIKKEEKKPAPKEKEIKIVEKEEEEKEEPEPEITIIKKKERKQLTEEDKKKLFKDGHGVILDFEINKLNSPYKVQVGVDLGYKNYNLIRPFYFGGIIKPFLGMPGENFPFTYKTATETLKNPYMVGTKIMAPVGFCYYPLKNSFELYAEALIGIAFTAVWNGSLPPAMIISKVYPTVDVAAKLGASWDFINMAFNIDYNPITNFTFGVSLGLNLNLGGSRVIGGSRVK